MTRRSERSRLLTVLNGVVTACLIGALMLPTGCGKEEEPPPPPPPAPPPPPPPPEPVEIDPLMQSMRVDARVQFPQAQAPVDEALAESVIRLASALATGDAQQMRSLLTGTAETVLDELLASGAWYDATAQIEGVRVVRLLEPASVTLAIQEPDGAYVLGWAATKRGGSYVFEAMPTTDEVRRRASDFDNSVPPPDMPAVSGSFDVDMSEMNEAMREAMEEALEQGGGGVEEPERDDRRRNTPAGPIDVPGGG